MHLKISVITWGFLFWVLPGAIFSQTGEGPEAKLVLEEIRAQRARVEANTILEKSLQARILEVYDQAIGFLDMAAAEGGEAERFVRERNGVNRMVEALRRELGRPEPEPRSSIPDGATVEQAEGILERERSGLSAYRSALRDTEGLVEVRASARNESSRRLGELDQLMESLADQLRDARERETHPEVKRAVRASLLAQREAAVSESKSLREELSLLDARGALIPWKIDKAQRRVAYGVRVVAQVEAATVDLRRQNAELALERIRELCRQVAEQSVTLGPVAAETENLAEMLWGPEGIVVESEATTKTLVGTRKYISDLGRIIEVTRRKFKAFGQRGSITRWWPEIPENFPKPVDVESTLLGLEWRIPEVQHRLIQLEQQRSRTREFSNRLLIDLRMEKAGNLEPELEENFRSLLNTRRDVLDKLIRRFERESNQMVELEAVSRHFLAEVERVQTFLYERVLWARSVPRPVVPRPGQIAEAFTWHFSWNNWRQIFQTPVSFLKSFPFQALGILVFFGLLVGFRPLMRKRLGILAGRVKDPDRDTFSATLDALLQTVLLSAPMPLALYLGHHALQNPDASLFVSSAGRALYYVAGIAALLEFTRQMLSPHGLAEGHFGWPSRFIRPLHRRLLVPEIVFLILIFVSTHLVMAGQRFTSPKDLQVYNNSLGRVAFIAAMMVLGLSLLGLFRPRRGAKGSGRPSGMTPENRFSLRAYPATFLATIVPASLALLGFYITGLLLAFQMFRTFWLMTILLVMAGLVHRWRIASLRTSSAATEKGSDDAGEKTSLLAADVQVRKLFRFVVILVAVVGLYNIWSEAFPMLQVMKRVQIWPRIAMIDSGEKLDLAPLGISPGVTATTPSVESEPEASGSSPSIPGIPIPASGGTGESVGKTADSSPLTLWNLVVAVIAGVFTLILVRNLPGLLEMVLLRRTHIDAGTRIAASTLVRYAILIFGTSLAFSLLGISWSKIQWLAAALTFGLGFGLQEIVANFVSGLILLMERPVRVGDAVTIGNLMGQVSQIRIRATTVTLWDRSEMVVPNKEFITTKLINWTLSDSKRRIDIPMRIAYGSDLQKTRKILLKVARDHPDVLDDPAPYVILLDFGDDAIHFELRFFVDFGKGLMTKDALQMGIDRAFRENGIEFAIPRLNIQVPMGTEGSGEHLPTLPIAKKGD